MPTGKEELKDLTLLGHKEKATCMLETFPNHGGKRIQISLLCTEFTSLCPQTSQPDFAQIKIQYQPDQLIVETKSLKLFLERYRDVGIFNEHLAVELGDSIYEALQPNSVTVTVIFNVRGGIVITAEYTRSKGDSLR